MPQKISTGQRIDTVQEEWEYLRFNVESNDAAIAAATRSWGSKADPAKGRTGSAFTALCTVQMPQHANAVEILFWGDDSVTEYADYELNAYAANGPAIMLASGRATMGAAQAFTDPVTDDTYLTGAAEFFVDEITNTNDEWNGGTLMDIGSNDRVGRISFDLRGYQWLDLRFTSVSACAGMSAAFRVY